MKLFLVARKDETGWDEYDGFVIAAETKRKALSIARDTATEPFRIHGTTVDGSYGVWVAKEINPATEMEGIILSSYQNG